MPYQPHVRVRLNGTLGAGLAPPEIFSYGLSLSNSQIPSDAICAAILQEATSYHARAASKISESAIMTEVAISLVGPDGLQIGDTKRLPASVPGSIGSVVHPPQVSYRVSLGDGTRSRSGRGGWYVPLPSVSLRADTLTMSEADGTTLLGSAASFVQGLNSLGGGLVCIASSVSGNRVVTKLRVGLALDTIRRRRSSVDEAYRESPVPA